MPICNYQVYFLIYHKFFTDTGLDWQWERSDFNKICSAKHGFWTKFASGEFLLYFVL